MPAKSVIANFIKQLRKTSGLSAEEVTAGLREYGITISAKTLYGYENGASMPNADVFVTLCRIYKCSNPMDLFGVSSMEPCESDMVEKYRGLDAHGREMVDFTLLKEWERSTAAREPKPRIIPMMAKDDPLYVNAAHAEDYANAPEELKQLEEDIMDDENF